MDNVVKILQFLLVFSAVLLAHTILLSTEILEDVKVLDTQAKIQHITLTKMAIKKPTASKLLEDITEKVEEPKKEHLDTKRVSQKERRKPRQKKVLKKKKIPKKKKNKKQKKRQHRLVSHKQKIYATKENLVTLKDKYIGYIRTEIRKKLVYPSIAKRMRMEDVIYVAFTVYKNGHIGNIRVLKGHKDILKKSAIKTLEKITIKSIPTQLGVTQLELKLPISFKIVRG